MYTLRNVEVGCRVVLPSLCAWMSARVRHAHGRSKEIECCVEALHMHMHMYMHTCLCSRARVCARVCASYYVTSCPRMCGRLRARGYVWTIPQKPKFQMTVYFFIVFFTGQAMDRHNDELKSETMQWIDTKNTKCWKTVCNNIFDAAQQFKQHLTHQKNSHTAQRMLAESFSIDPTLDQPHIPFSFSFAT